MTKRDSARDRYQLEWKVSFSPWMTFVGSFIGGSVAGGVLAGNILLGDPVGEDLSSQTIGQAAVLVLGTAIAVFLLLGPVLGWGLGFALRNVENNGMHILAFAALGLVVGFSVGEFLGRLVDVVGLGVSVAPAAGIGAAVGRWAISRFAKR
jgi:hypothetical protein